MSPALAHLADWLARTLIAGGLVLGVAWLAMCRTRSVRGQRMIGVAAVHIALLVPLLAWLPAWVAVPRLMPEASDRRVVDLPSSLPSGGELSESVSSLVSPVPPPRTPGPSDQISVTAMGSDAPSGPSAGDDRSREADRAAGAWMDLFRDISAEDGITTLLIAYGVGSGVMALRWLVGMVGIARLLRRSQPAPAALDDMLGSLHGGTRRPRLRVVEGIASPMCWGGWRPTIVLPQRLISQLTPRAWRWILSHESAHLNHADPRTALALGLAAVLYYPLPWFWLLRRRLRLCQEHLADSDTVTDDESPMYAALLLRLSRGAGQRHGLVGHAVLGNPSDLYWRITMLLKRSEGSEAGLSKGWAVVSVAGLLLLAIVLSGFGWMAGVAAAGPDDAKDQPKTGQADSKKDSAKESEPVKPEPGERFLRPRDLRNMIRRPEGMDPAEFEKRIQQWMEEMQKRFNQFQPGIGGFEFPNFPGFGNVPPRTPGRLGVLVEKPSAALIEQLDLPEGQGLLLGDVTPDSPAAKAGLKPNDILLEFNGKPVPSEPQEFRAMVNETKADTEVSAVVLRKGKRETIKGIKLPEVKAEPADPLAGGLIPLPQFPPIPALEGLGGVQGGSRSLQIQIANDQFSLQSRQDNLAISLAGKIEGGKRVLNSIKIKDGEEEHTYDNIDNVPEKYRGQIEELLKRITIKGQ